MRLSEAILLGHSLVKRDPAQWLSDDGSCGCAFGGAMVAAGIGEQYVLERHQGTSTHPAKFYCVRQVWPWLRWEHLAYITQLHRMLSDGGATIEQIAEYVRSVEPAEKEQEFIRPDTSGKSDESEEPIFCSEIRGVK